MISWSVLCFLSYSSTSTVTPDLISTVNLSSKTVNAIDVTGAAIGQTNTPIPVVGALVGSIVATTALSLGKGVLNKHEIEIINLYQERVNGLVDKLDKEYQVKLDKLLNKYHKLGKLQKYSFDFNVNLQLRFVSSIEIAKSVGVAKQSVLKNEDEIDEYFLC